MDREQIRRLEEVCEQALADALRPHVQRPIEPRVYHLMAKAAVTVLEAVDEKAAKK